jgi:hypothetical protein
VVVSDSSRIEIFSPNREICSRQNTLLSRMLQEAEPVVLQDKYDLEGFESYVRYLDSEGAAFPELDEDNLTILPLIRLYAVAHQLGDLTSANTTIDRIMQVVDVEAHWLNPKEITYAYEMEVASNALRKLFVDFQIHEMHTETLSLEKGEVPFEYMRDVAVGFARITEQTGDRGKHKESDDIFRVRLSSHSDETKCKRYHKHDEFHPSCFESTDEEMQEDLKDDLEEESEEDSEEDSEENPKEDSVF